MVNDSNIEIKKCFCVSKLLSVICMTYLMQCTVDATK